MSPVLRGGLSGFIVVTIVHFVLKFTGLDNLPFYQSLLVAEGIGLVLGLKLGYLFRMIDKSKKQA